MSCRPLEEPSANLSFQSFDLLRESGLRNMKPERSTSKMQLFCEHHKRSQCIDAETHSRMLSPWVVWCVIVITDF